MLDEMLGLDGFYFSPTFHMTHTLQRQANLKPDGKGMWAMVGFDVQLVVADNSLTLYRSSGGRPFLLQPKPSNEIN
jgi:hypothetical protein